MNKDDNRSERLDDDDDQDLVDDVGKDEWTWKDKGFAVHVVDRGSCTYSMWVLKSLPP